MLGKSLLLFVRQVYLFMQLMVCFNPTFTIKLLIRWFQ